MLMKFIFYNEEKNKKIFFCGTFSCGNTFIYIYMKEKIYSKNSFDDKDEPMKNPISEKNIMIFFKFRLKTLNVEICHSA